MLVLVSELEISREPPKFGLGKGVGGWVEWFCWGVKFWLANFVFGYFAFCSAPQVLKNVIMEEALYNCMYLPALLVNKSFILSKKRKEKRNS